MDNQLDKKENIMERKISWGEKLSLKIRKSFIVDKTKTVLLIIILVFAFIVLNKWVQTRELAQIDLTKSKIYTLTQNSKDMIKDIKDEVNIYVYGYDENHEYVKFLKQYVTCNPNIKCEIITESTHYDIITTYNMGTYNEIRVVSNGKDVALYPDYTFQTTEYINGVAQNIDIREQSITNAIVKVTTKDPAKIYFVSGHGELDDSSISILLGYLESSIYEYEFLNLLSATIIPEDCDILAILSPDVDYTAGEAEVVKNYVNNGGNILVAMTTAGNSTEFINLQTVFDLYAVTIEDGILYEGNPNNCMSVQGQSIPIVLLPNYSYGSDITSDIEVQSVFSVAQSIIFDSAKAAEMNVSSEELLYTSEKAYNVKDYENGFNIDGLEPSSYVLGRKVEKNIQAEGEETKKSQLIIIGNDTFLADYDSIIGNYPISYTGNNELLMNCLKNLSEKEDIMEIAKNIDISSFTATVKQDNIVQFIVYAFPIIIIIGGIVVWTIRKRMR